MVISLKKIVVQKLNTGPIWSRIQEVTMEGPTGSFHLNPLPPSFLGKYNLAIILGNTFCVFLSRFASSSFGPLHDTCPVPDYCYGYLLLLLLLLLLQPSSSSPFIFHFVYFSSWCSGSQSFARYTTFLKPTYT